MAGDAPDPELFRTHHRYELAMLVVRNLTHLLMLGVVAYFGADAIDSIAGEDTNVGFVFSGSLSAATGGGWVLYLRCLRTKREQSKELQRLRSQKADLERRLGIEAAADEDEEVE